MRSQAHPAAAEELAALVVEASGRRTREEFLAEVAAAAAPIDREATGWFDPAAGRGGGPTVQRRVDRRTKRMEAYPPIDRTAAQAPGGGVAPTDAQAPGGGVAPTDARDARTRDQATDPEDAPTRAPAASGDAADAGDPATNGRAARGPGPYGGPPTGQDAGP
jgi:hypothetical protein